MDGNDKFLEISIHDNDLYFTLEFVGNMMNDIMQFSSVGDRGEFSQDEIDKLKIIVQELLFNARELRIMCDNRFPHTDKDYFKPDIRVVNGSEVEEWDNAETLYIPLSYDGEIFIR